MKHFLLAASLLFLFSCNENKKSVFQTFSDKNPVDQSCECQYYKDKSFPLYVTNLEVNQKTISFNCTELEVAIAEKVDVNGVPQGCESLYSLRCVSAKPQQLILDANFTYSKNAEVSTSQTDFYKDLKENPKAIFEFSLNNQNQINVIEKLEY